MHLCLHLSALYLLFLPPYSPVDPATTATDVDVYDYYVDDQALATELPGKQCPFPSPRYRLSVYIYLCTRHYCCYVRFLFCCMTCFCRPLMYLFLYPMLPSIILQYSAVGPAPVSLLGLDSGPRSLWGVNTDTIYFTATTTLSSRHRKGPYNGETLPSRPQVCSTKGMAS